MGPVDGSVPVVMVVSTSRLIFRSQRDDGIGPLAAIGSDMEFVHYVQGRFAFPKCCGTQLGLDLDARSTLHAGLMGITPAIRIAGLVKSYGDIGVLRGVDLDVAPGSVFALLGSNGAGKTTVVKILSTLLKADAGAVVVNGFDVAR